MARVLMLPFAPGAALAHVAACASVGDQLRRRGHDVVFAYGGSLPAALERDGFTCHPVPELAPERVFSAWFDTTADLERLVRARLDLIEELEPDACVTSSGVAGGIAAELAGLPEVNLNHYLALTSYGRRATALRRRVGHLRGARRLAWATKRNRRRGSVRDRDRELVAELRYELGLAPARPDLGGAGPAAVNACTTTPFLDPARGLPPSWHYTGPLSWSAPTTLRGPARSDRPLVYVTQGSTGAREMLVRTVRALAAEPVDVLVGSASIAEPAELAALGPRVSAARYLPSRACIEAADVAVVHGGHLTTADALLSGTPLVVIPSSADQIASGYRAERLGVGIALWPKPRAEAEVAHAVGRVLTRSRYAQRARALAERLADPRWDGSRNAADLVERQLTRGREQARRRSQALPSGRPGQARAPAR